MEKQGACPLVSPPAVSAAAVHDASVLAFPKLDETKALVRQGLVATADAAAVPPFHVPNNLDVVAVLAVMDSVAVVTGAAVVAVICVSKS